MMRFKGLEGVRAWLSCAVAFVHWTMITGLAANGYIPKLNTLADQAVLVFIVLSGFVISHLIIEKKESYPQYIIRRFMRIAPLYYFAFFVSIFTATSFWDFTMWAPWGDITPQVARSQEFYLHVRQFGYFPYIASHLALFHGAISETILPRAPLMFLPPSWSLSLEWQFYLVAPVIIAALANRRTALLLVLSAILLNWAARKGAFGQMGYHDSLLPLAAFAFSLGVGSRLFLAKAAPFASYPFIPVVMIAAFLALNAREHLYIGCWIALLPLLKQGDWQDQPSKSLSSLYEYTCQSRIASWVGDRSYAIYILHYPLFEALVVLFGQHLRLSYGQSVLLTALTGFPALLLLSDLAHRFIELPGIRLGQHLTRSVSHARPATGG